MIYYTIFYPFVIVLLLNYVGCLKINKTITKKKAKVLVMYICVVSEIIHFHRSRFTNRCKQVRYLSGFNPMLGISVLLLMYSQRISRELQEIYNVCKSLGILTFVKGTDADFLLGGTLHQQIILFAYMQLAIFPCSKTVFIVKQSLS